MGQLNDQRNIDMSTWENFGRAGGLIFFSETIEIMANDWLIAEHRGGMDLLVKTDTFISFTSLIYRSILIQEKCAKLIIKKSSVRGQDLFLASH